MELEEFRLRQTLAGHTQDIKYALTLPNGDIISASRDSTLKLWKAGKDNLYEDFFTLAGHSNFVNAVVDVPVSKQFPSGAFITGSTDSLVLVWDKRDLTTPFYTLIGHSNTICSVSHAKGQNTIISGSYDGTSIVWDLDTGAQKFVLDGHKPSVLCVLAMADGRFLTGGADKLIKLWSHTGSLEKEFAGHTDAVRKLIECDLGLASCSNDGSVRVWDISGECLQQYVGHQSFVYGISCIKGIQEFATCGEDQLVNIWKNGKDVQSIAHPGTVWSVEHRTSSNGIDELVTGCSDGMVRIWTKDAAFALPEAQMAAYYADIEKMAKEQGKQQGQGAGMEINGQKYDYVWNVDLGGNNPMLYLGHNQGNDPMDSARNFIYQNRLSEEHTQTIVDFIKKNTSQFELSNAPVVESQGTAPLPVEPVVKGPPPLFPVISPIKFSITTSLMPLQKRILSGNEDLILGENSCSLTDEEILCFNELVSVMKNQSKYHVSTISTAHALLLVKLLSWPSEHLFACHDFVRMICVHPAANAALAGHPLVELLIASGIHSEASPKNFMTACQALSNLFSLPSFGASLRAQSERILTGLQSAIQSPSQLAPKPSASALATVLLNFSTLYHNHVEGDGMIFCCTVLLELLNSSLSLSPEATFRALAALGTLCSSEFISQYCQLQNLTFLEALKDSSDARITKAVEMLSTVVGTTAMEQ